MKRFYKNAQAGTAPGGFVVRLDGKILKTPLQHNLILSTQELAELIAGEWQAQGKDIVPASMPLTQLANTMVDKSATEDRSAMTAEIMRYAGSDLVCYLATHPADLVKRQEECWLPLIEWIKEAHGIGLHVVRGIQYVQQEKDNLEKMKSVIESLNSADFTVVQAATGIAGSVVIALALLEGRVTPETAWQAACVDEIYQLEKWGEDDLARKRLEKIRLDLDAVSRFKASLSH